MAHKEYKLRVIYSPEIGGGSYVTNFGCFASRARFIDGWFRALAEGKDYPVPGAFLDRQPATDIEAVEVIF